jgi:hypothetical protein
VSVSRCFLIDVFCTISISNQLGYEQFVCVIYFFKLLKLKLVPQTSLCITLLSARLEYDGHVFLFRNSSKYLLRIFVILHEIMFLTSKITSLNNNNNNNNLEL